MGVKIYELDDIYERVTEVEEVKAILSNIEQYDYLFATLFVKNYNTDDCEVYASEYDCAFDHYVVECLTDNEELFVSALDR